MFRTFRIAFSLKNTYRVNSILFALKQTPLIKKILPQEIYGVQELKIVANILAGLWEIFMAFAGKALYFVLMLLLPLIFFENQDSATVFLHVYVFLTAIGAFGNTFVFNPSRDKYYAMVLMRMDAKEYTLSNYAYFLLKMAVGYLVFGALFGSLAGLSIAEIMLLPLSVVGSKCFMMGALLRRYEKTGIAPNENRGGKAYWISMGVLLALAYGFPFITVTLPRSVSTGILCLFAALGFVFLKKILKFPRYYEVQKEILNEMLQQFEKAEDAVQVMNHNAIVMDESHTSNKSGFTYLNELFVKRHHKILWKTSCRITFVVVLISAAILVILYQVPGERSEFASAIMKFMPYFVFIMYTINQGNKFTNALFVNCDHCLLTYPFYKQPKHILKLFRLRLWELVKINLLPAVAMATGISSWFVFCGRMDALNFVIVYAVILGLSIFFSVHSMTVYYLLQPFNAGTEIKSGTYQLVNSVTYVIAFICIYVRMDLRIFGVGCIAFCILYCVLAFWLVYRFAPKTFRIR